MLLSNSSAPREIDADIKEALLALLDVLTLSEPIQVRLWQKAGITLTQLSVLRELRRGPQASGRLGQAVGLSPASITRLLDRLEQRGWVRRRRDSEDRRCVEIHLEPKAQRLLSEIKVFRGSDLHHAVESMTAAERRELVTVLRRFAERARTTNAAPALVDG